MIASLFPLWVEIPLAAVSAVGTIVGTILSIINLDLAVKRLRAGAGNVRAKLRRGP